jgi:ABC-type branched-subunit amino acid transport system ATPase component
VGPLLSISGLSVSYSQFRALHDIDMEVAPGEIVAIIGANGGGKSSLLKAILGQAGRVSGSIRFGGRDIAALPTTAIVAAGIALVPEGRRLFPSLTVEELLRAATVPAATDLGAESAAGAADDVRHFHHCLKWAAPGLQGGHADPSRRRAGDGDDPRSTEILRGRATAADAARRGGAGAGA